MINLLQRKRVPSSILGLALDGSRLEGVVLRRTNGSLQVQKSFASTLTLNPMTADPELVGREIRNHLDQAGIRERRCVVGVPLNWALTLHTKIPDVPEEDVAGFLEIEAERGFPYGPEALSLVTSRYRSAGGEFATLVAIPRNHLLHLDKVLRAAQLRPVSFTLAITALQGTGKNSANVLALGIGENAIDLQVTYDGGVVALRALEGAIETEGVQRQFQGDVIAREIRVTLAQLPDEIRGAVRKARIFGQGEFAQRFAQEVGPQLQAMGLQPEPVKAYAPDEFRSKPPSETAVSAAFSMAARYLTGTKSEFEYLPPKVSSFQQLTSRFSSRKLAWAGATAAAAALLIGGTVGIQQWQLARLRSQWAVMEPNVNELDAIQQQIRKFRPWFDDSLQSLTILRRLTESFPLEGTVTAKTLEIHDLSTVTCSGTARDNEAFLKMLNQLRTAKEVGEVKVDSVRGKAPLQFTLNFQWGQRRQGEN
jgi:hypothetical protein